MVERLTPSSRAMLEMLLPGRVSRSRAWRICSAVIAGAGEALAAGAGGVQALAGAFHDELADEVEASGSARDRAPYRVPFR